MSQGRKLLRLMATQQQFWQLRKIEPDRKQAMRRAGARHFGRHL
jgi:hypothetical protein